MTDREEDRGHTKSRCAAAGPVIICPPRENPLLASILLPAECVRYCVCLVDEPRELACGDRAK